MVRHRGKRVHALGARDARHQLDRERGHAGGRDLLDRVHVAQRPQEPDQYLAAAIERHIRLAGLIIGAVAQHLDNDVGSAKDLGPVGYDLGALVDVVRVGISGLDSRSRFDDDLQACFDQVRNHRRYQRNPPFPREALPGNTDNHAASSQRDRFRRSSGVRQSSKTPESSILFPVVGKFIPMFQSVHFVTAPPPAPACSARAFRSFIRTNIVSR